MRPDHLTRCSWVNLDFRHFSIDISQTYEHPEFPPPSILLQHSYHLPMRSSVSLILLLPPQAHNCLAVLSDSGECSLFPRDAQNNATMAAADMQMKAFAIRLQPVHSPFCCSRRPLGKISASSTSRFVAAHYHPLPLLPLAFGLFTLLFSTIRFGHVCRRLMLSSPYLLLPPAH